MNVRRVRVDALTVPEYCRRVHSREQIGRFVKSFRRHGQYQPLITSGNEILCGVLAYLAFRQMGKKTCFVNDLGPLPLERRKEIRYLDNQIFDIEDWESESLKRFLMSTSLEELDRLGFSPDETELYVNLEPETAKPIPAAWNGRWICESCGWTGVMEEK